jgi:dihydroxyacetone kinase-like protein
MAEIDRLTAKPLPEVLTGLGTTLVMKVGGASGPLYGTLLKQLGKHLPADPGLPDLLAACDAAVAAVAARGRAEAGCKTLLDVLLPVAAAAHAGAAAPQALLERLPEVAEQAAAATVPLRALRGRAAFLGERSIGHMDPGARSAALLIAAACRALKADA